MEHKKDTETPYFTYRFLTLTKPHFSFLHPSNGLTWHSFDMGYVNRNMCVLDALRRIKVKWSQSNIYK